jgi:hypothetical protein
LGQTAEVISRLDRDCIQLASIQMMGAIMGMRRLWLSTTRWTTATQATLLALPFQLGGTLFPGAQQAIREAAEAATSFKDSKALLESPQPRPFRRQSSLAPQQLLPRQSAPAQWVRPLGRGQGGKKKKGKKGRQAGRGGQPFRPEGESAQAPL